MNAFLKTFCLLCLGVDFIFCDVTIIRPDESDLERPTSNDLYTVRSFFKSRNYCQRMAVRKDPTKPLRLSAETFELPSVNATVIDSDMVISGLHKGVITDFYVNKLTGNAVLTLDFKDINYLETATFSFHRKGQEDLIVAVPGTTEYYKSVTTTTISAGNLKFRPWNTNTHIHINVPAQYNFPGVEDVNDPEVNNLFSLIVANENATIEELNLRRGSILSFYYISNLVCNFKYNPTV